MSKIKEIVKFFLPAFFIRFFHNVRNKFDNKRRLRMTPKEIFSEIYAKKLWGDGSNKFISGPGSIEEWIICPYIEKIISFLKVYPTRKPKVVDLGCGDFEVGKNLINYCSEYVGVDVVPQLIEELNKTQSGPAVRFVCLDIIDDDLPDGDIVFVRQVFQHLSNEQIIKVLPKLRKYKVAFITEHYPSPNPNIKPNENMVPGSDVRASRNSGVYLDKAPFNMSQDLLQLILEVPGAGLGKGYDEGVIRTYKLEFGR